MAYTTRKVKQACQFKGNLPWNIKNKEILENLTVFSKKLQHIFKKFTKSKFVSVILKCKDTMYKFETFQIYNEDIQNKSQISNYKFQENSKFHLLYIRIWKVEKICRISLFCENEMAYISRTVTSK